MDISIIQGNKYIQFWSRVTKPGTESCAEKNCDDRQSGTVCNKVKLQSGFQSFLRNHAR